MERIKALFGTPTLSFKVVWEARRALEVIYVLLGFFVVWWCVSHSYTLATIVGILWICVGIFARSTICATGSIFGSEF